jgi:hypothetical protein
VGGRLPEELEGLDDDDIDNLDMSDAVQMNQMEGNSGALNKNIMKGKHGGRMGVNDEDTDEFEMADNIMFDQ